MTLFRSYGELSPGEQQRAVNDEFVTIVTQSPFRLWSPGDAIPSQGVRILIGVATWSGFDMRLLDVIAEGLARDAANAPVVQVFNTADCRDQQSFTHYIPNMPSVCQTPVAGIWRDGRLEWFEQGYAARDHLARMFGSTSDAIVNFVSTGLGVQPRTRTG